MLKTYRINNYSIEIDDSRPVRELVRRYFEENDYYEPFGMHIVTVFAAHCESCRCGWFVTDPDLPISEALKGCDPEWLCVAYHLPGIFYYAEGGWGHHMHELDNHPDIPNAESLYLRFEDFDNCVVLNGAVTMKQIILKLLETGYLEGKFHYLEYRLLGEYEKVEKDYVRSLNDPGLDIPLSDRDEFHRYAYTEIHMEE